jgi:hypothetical protein
MGPGEIRPALPFTDIVQPADVGVLQAAGGACLPPEAFDKFVVTGEFRQKHLQCDFAPEPLIADTVHLRHTSRADLPQHLIGTDAVGRLGGVDHDPRCVPLAGALLLGFLVRGEKGLHLAAHIGV